MSAAITFRPRFKLEVPYSPEEISIMIDAHLTNHNPKRIRWRKVGDHIVFRTHPDDRHFWTPQLDISLEVLENNRTLLRCLIAPLPAVWTMYIFLYAVLGLGGLVALMAGFSQWSLDHTPWAFYFVPVSVLGSVIMIFFARFGQQLSREEMKLLKNTLLEALQLTESEAEYKNENHK